MEGNIEEPKKVDVDKVTEELSEALKDELRIVTATLGDTNGIRLFASFAGLDLQELQADPNKQQSPNWQAEIGQRLKSLNWEVEEEQEFNKTVQDLATITRKTSEVFKAEYGEQEGLQKMADIANSYMPKDQNMRPKFQLTVPKTQG